MDLAIEPGKLVVLVACLVAIVTRRLKIPYTVGLVCAGLILAVSSVSLPFHLSKDLVYGTLLPPLIFEAAYHLKWRDLRSVLIPVSVLASLGVIAAAAVTTALLVLFMGFSFPTAAIIGVALSATDPVSVLALLKEQNVSGKTRLVVESESLFNDGTAAVIFMLLFQFLEGTPTIGSTLSGVAIGIVGAGVTGALVGGLCLYLVGRTEDHLVETAVTVLAAFGSFSLAEHFHASGVLATLVAGMMLGNLGQVGALTTKGHQEAASFWEFAGFMANSFIFLLIGMDLSEKSLQGLVIPTVATVLASLVGRMVAVYGGCAITNCTNQKVSFPVQNLLMWGGLRGALTLALVLGLPASTIDRQLIVTSVFHAVAFSIVVQGLTVTPLIRSIQRQSTD